MRDYSNLIKRLKAGREFTEIQRGCGDQDHDRRSASLARAIDEAILALSVAPAPVAAEALPIELVGISEAIAEGSGFWTSCSGCHELNEGHPTGPYSKVFKCSLGIGCHECGGIGAVWDSTDYAAMADALLADEPAPPVQEGPKGVEADAKFESLLQAYYSAVCEGHFAGSADTVAATAEAEQALRTYFKKSQQQAAQAELAAEHWKGIVRNTIDDNVRKQCTSPAQSIPAAIDEEGREAINHALAALRKQADTLRYCSDDSQNFVTAPLKKNIATLERLLAGN